MNNAWKIRKAISEDSIGLQSCMESAYSTYQDRMGENRLPPMDVDYTVEIRDYPVWVVELDGKITGGLIMMFEAGYASIANIAVHPDFQGQGIGNELMMFAESIAGERNYSELRLATHILLTENVSLYQHLGWMEVDRDVNFRLSHSFLK
jgi:ribosomal protein S18 acetylase RimI-like enzyme